ncbi:hypothetical protein FEDK69T_03350 [Flavobacterium enshiense DK69]|uniref:Lipocalin-like domain-containing protein n=1 Tax=Flavobacterium enshiense DK69 TaxID=1107311 RepID=V6SDM8_9FLAO|nr:lipocalin family protein [Flavobacterium enshiense]ESU24783.1 hypothetical protein FEDK69T_03350 [Flavobacterium enshiense DK69]KGO96764.1 hypothetical protein Q767_03400 [Flavobacterium enshiense DK69]
MKFNKTLLFILGFLISVSCSKDDNASDDSRQLLIGKWRQTGSVMPSSGESYTANYCESQTIFEYLNNGELIRNLSYGETPCSTHINQASFEKKGNIITITSSEVYYKLKIITLNSTTLKYEMFYDSQFGTVDDSDKVIDIFTRVNE